MKPIEDRRGEGQPVDGKSSSGDPASPAAIATVARFRGHLTQALARRRVPIGFLVGAAVLWLAEPTAATLAAGTAIAGAGECLRVWASGHLNKAREVTTSGPYRWFAHPLYMGSSIIGVGLAVASGSFMVGSLIALYLLTTLTAAIRSEEVYLRHTFGDRYDRYRSGGDDDAAGRRRFSVARAIANREHRALVGLAVAVLLLALKATYNGLFWRAAGGR